MTNDQRPTTDNQPTDSQQPTNQPTDSQQPTFISNKQQRRQIAIAND